MKYNFDPDWAELDRYAKSNKIIMTDISSSNLDRIVLMGDSITEYWLELRPDFFKGKPIVNRGISGQTTPQMLLRFRQDVVLLKPKAVVILAGINDIAGNTGPTTLEAICNHIFSMVELALANQIQVVMCSVLPANRFDWNPKQKPAEEVVELNKRLKAYASKNDLTYIDYYPHMVDNELGLKAAYGEDGVHPNKVGYQVMEPLLEEGLKKVNR
ncbi:GDSL-type esterase/lipase family protein [Labilibacter marinus]|uniref:GDSL-type esterase/lipase family protein n=1 Tax=Labilibacter marinus TaxID=1477105 RepID=UPI000B08F530|nr:GDSL-type esterase/lipase family protein [Labilibacter marinus]